MQKVIAVVKDADGVEHRLSMWEEAFPNIKAYRAQRDKNANGHFDGLITDTLGVERIERPLTLPQNLGAVIRVTWPDVADAELFLRVQPYADGDNGFWHGRDGDYRSYEEVKNWADTGATVEVLHEGWVQP